MNKIVSYSKGRYGGRAAERGGCAGRQGASLTDTDRTDETQDVDARSSARSSAVSAVSVVSVDRADSARGSADVALAIDFGGSKIAACVLGRDGSLLGEDVVATTPALGAEANLARGVALAERLARGRRVAAVGACTFGIPHEDGVALSPAIEGWDALPIRRRLEAAFDAPAVVETDVKLAAAAEARRGALIGCDPAIYVNLGTGLAVAIVSGGIVVRGAHGASGEIGYCIPRRGPDTARGVRSLEDVVSGMGLARALSLTGVAGATGASPRTAADALAVATLFGPAGAVHAGAATGSVRGDGAAGDGASALLEEFLDELTFHVVNLTVAVDPERIAVGGGLVHGWGRIEGPLRRALAEHVPYPPELVLGAYPFDAPLRGAVDLALELAARAVAGSG